MDDQEAPVKPEVTCEVAFAASRDGGVAVDHVAEMSEFAPDIAAVRQAFWNWPSWCGSATPESAWANAVSGDTAARMSDGCGEVTDWECTAQIIAKAAAYGWWPQGVSDGDYIAVPIDRWVADGHPYSKIVPNLGAMLDRWNVAPVVIDVLDDPAAIEASG